MNTGILPWPQTNPARSCKREARTISNFLGDPRTDICSLSIRDTRRKDGGVYLSRLERGPVMKFSFKQKTLSLNVTGLCLSPSQPSPRHLTSKSQQLWNLAILRTCYVSAAWKSRKSLIFSWTWGTVISLGPGTPHFSEITIIPLPWSHGSNITCQVTFPRFHVTTEMTIQLSVSYAPQNLTISVFHGNKTAPVALENATSLSVLKNQSLRFVYVTDSNPPARLSWTWEGQALNLSQSSESAVLELPPVESGDGGEFVCQAQHPLGSQHVSVSLSVQSDSVISIEEGVLQTLGFTLIRGILMGTSCTFICGFTWICCTRIRGSQRSMAGRVD
nr:sialic acid-binding Ig-like lectin 14 [Gorilla gorilla gorilla]